MIGPNSCTVSVDSINGEVIYYNEWLAPITISAEPTLTPNQAMFAAMQLFSNAEPVRIDELYITRPDMLNSERLVYNLVLLGQAPGRVNVSTWAAGVDANTGEVLYTYLLQGLVKPGPKPKIAPKPTTHNSDTVSAPERHNTISAQEYTPAISLTKGRRVASTPIDS